MKLFSRNYINLDSDLVQYYGLNIIMRKYLCVPKWLPFIAFMEHGWTALDYPINSYLELKDYPLMFVDSKRRFKAYFNVKHNFKRILITGMPFILYRKSENLCKEIEAKGTVAFPSHGTVFLKSEYNIKEYCAKLKELSSEFHPITICLHTDNMYQKEIFTTLGFEVVTAGTRYDKNFLINFYNILKRHKYSTSNIVGSHLFYSIDLNIPFFIMGEEPEYINNPPQNPDVPGKYKISDFLYGKEAYDFFNTGPVTSISEEQKEYVEKETGIMDASNRIILFIYYWFYFIQWICVKIIYKITNIMPSRLKLLLKLLIKKKSK